MVMGGFMWAFSRLSWRKGADSFYFSSFHLIRFLSFSSTEHEHMILLHMPLLIKKEEEEEEEERKSQWRKRYMLAILMFSHILLYFNTHTYTRTLSLSHPHTHIHCHIHLSAHQQAEWSSDWEISYSILCLSARQPLQEIGAPFLCPMLPFLL